ncbi:tRNA 2-thiouridine(34) synthase MnmA [Gordonibacter massiliensis (ex Traore et al. 2017)]|uniref:tRNA 2-thiouridine(34) synthase MnmA n=1 Tax=Gordonibacter massiliensis (ex Traore et al. 2017) TaxID=1841863 RepID=UPI001C8B3B00|nr:tRNA 2-thiouridine(34) synthase MnmA [Gordonibacter massiliensis (ex Traore et al. 2017)]MBX9034105.1 tRNA 2-thiouridine(34) synthase MnmA [Gordonibacter massiliensis (ex Traore et al. 2017)]
MAVGDNGPQRVALGMSGGVDSAVSAALLMRAGYEVVGVTCRFTDDAAADRAAADAAAVCARLGVRHAERDCTGLFECEVVRPFVDGYAAGLTPSPCVGCNARCKLPALLDAADELGCRAVATGHYARIVQLAESGRYAVKAALDVRKDQSYMLALLDQDQLARLVLPLGGTTKAEVRVLAADLGLPVAEKPESQDVCFIEGDYRAFLQARGVDDRPGDIVDRSGTVLGRHDGLANFTVGQRKGIGIAASEPYYVVDKRPDTADLVVGFANEALIGGVLAGPVRWQAIERLDEPRAASVKLRYRSRAVPCIIEPEPEGRVRAVLREPQPTTAPGQFAVFSVGDTVLGGGMIEEVTSV